MIVCRGNTACALKPLKLEIGGGYGGDEDEDYFRLAMQHLFHLSLCKYNVTYA